MTMASQWRSLFKRRNSSVELSDGTARLAQRFRDNGVSASAVDKAAQHRLLWSTRLASALVELGEVDESTALEILCSHHDMPAVSLRRSVIDLSCPALPQELTRGRLLLPVHVNSEELLLLATTDPLDDGELQEVAGILGRETRQQVALHLHLERTIRAVQRLRAECEDAVYLLGDEIEMANVEQPGNHVLTVGLGSTPDSDNR